MDLESGDHLALSASVEMAVSFFALEVAPVAGSKSASQICWLPSRPLRNRMRLPSGENSRPLSFGLADGELDVALPRQSAAATAPMFWCSFQIDGGDGVA